MNIDFYTSNELREMGFGSVGENVWVGKNCHIVNPENIHLSDDIKINPFCTLVAYKGSSISIGKSVHIGGYSLLFALKPIFIGSFVSISSSVKIYTASDDFSGNSLLGFQIPDNLRDEKSKNIIVSNHCGISSGSILLPGAYMPEGTVLGANSLLKSIIEETWIIVAGNPAKKISVRNKKPLLYVNSYPR